MKINDKALAHFSSSSQIPPDKCGWLWKKGELNTSYQKRCSDKEPIGVIVIENCSVQLAEGGDSPYTFSISFDRAGLRVYKLTADDEATCNEWVRALSIASYSYLEILVDALEKELGELKANGSRSSVQSMSQAVPFPANNDRADNISQGPSTSRPDGAGNILSLPQPSEKKKKSPGLKRKKNKAAASNFFVDNAADTTDSVKFKANSIQVMNYSDRPFVALHAAYQYDIKYFIDEESESTTDNNNIVDSELQLS